MSIIIHDWGSVYGHLFQRDRPDLVSRIATLDIGGHTDVTLAYLIFALSYQMLFCLIFAMGDPLSTIFLKFAFYSFPEGAFGKVPRPIGELTGSMVYPYWQFWFVHFFNFKDEYLKDEKKTEVFHKVQAEKCPVFFAYGTQKPVMFHSDKWLSDLDKGKNCKQISLDC